MVARHHQFSKQDLGQIPADGEGQGSLVCCSPWGHEELDMTWRLNNNNDFKAEEVRCSMFTSDGANYCLIFCVLFV